jgi:hypothetical protein
MKYDEPEAGEWVKPVRKGYKLACCDCGLVHQFDFRVRKGKIEFRVYSDFRATGQIRRHMKH